VAVIVTTTFSHLVAAGSRQLRCEKILIMLPAAVVLVVLAVVQADRPRWLHSQPMHVRPRY